MKVFAKPHDQQEEEVFFYSMMFLVIASGSAIGMFLQVCSSVKVLCTFLWLFGSKNSTSSYYTGKKT